MPLQPKGPNMAIVSPLLFIGEFYLSPFHFKAENAVEISASDEEVVIKGNIDTLVLQEHLWVMVIESKRGSFTIEAGLPQICQKQVTRRKTQDSYRTHQTFFTNLARSFHELSCRRHRSTFSSCRQMNQDWIF